MITFPNKRIETKQELFKLQEKIPDFKIAALEVSISYHENCKNVNSLKMPKRNWRKKMKLLTPGTVPSLQMRKKCLILKTWKTWLSMSVIFARINIITQRKK